MSIIKVNAPSDALSDNGPEEYTDAGDEMDDADLAKSPYMYEDVADLAKSPYMYEDNADLAKSPIGCSEKTLFTIFNYV